MASLKGHVRSTRTNRSARLSGEAELLVGAWVDAAMTAGRTKQLLKGCRGTAFSTIV